MMFHIPEIELTIPISTSVNLQTLVNLIERKLKPSELVCLLSWLTEDLDWSDRRLLVMKVVDDWISDLSEEIEGIEEQRELVDLNDHLLTFLETLQDIQETLKTLKTTVKRTQLAIEKELKNNDASSEIFKE